MAAPSLHPVGTPRPLLARERAPVTTVIGPAAPPPVAKPSSEALRQLGCEISELQEKLQDIQRQYSELARKERERHNLVSP